LCLLCSLIAPACALPGKAAAPGLSEQADPGDRVVGRRRHQRHFHAYRERGARQALGQTIVIENRAGGGMNIGGRTCAEAPPDGTTICIMSNEVVTYNQYSLQKSRLRRAAELGEISPEREFTPASASGKKRICEPVRCSSSASKPGFL